MAKNEPERINKTSPDLNAERLAEVRRSLPDLFDDEGNLDELTLSQLFKSNPSTETQRFRFEWAGKQESKKLAFSPSLATLVADKKRSIGFDDTQNLIIEGDNLEVLKLLQATYFEQIKCIYIDPPYNTGKDFIYSDNFTQSKKAYWKSNGQAKGAVKLTALAESDGRKHSKWLNMLQSRLYAARNLLRQDGAIVTHIDEHEGHRLRILLEEVFGAENFLGEVVWDKRNPKGDATRVSYQHESILMFTKNMAEFEKHNKLEVPKRKASDETTQPQRKYILKENMSENLPSLLYYGGSDDKLLKDMDIPFDNPKPVEVAKRLMAGFIDGDDIVMDFFAGSGTAGHAVMELNAETEANAQFILVQVPEQIDEEHEAYKAGYKTISEICIDRVKKAGERIKGTDPKSPLDAGFRVYRLKESHFPENLFKRDPDKSEDENLAALNAHIEFAKQTRLFDKADTANIITEISLKNGYGLFFTLDQIEKGFAKNKVYRLAGNGKSTLICLDAELREASIDNLVENHAEEHLIVSKYALNTAGSWVLQNTFGDNIRVI